MASDKRTPMIAGNWKMHLTAKEAADLAAAIKKGLDPDLKHEVLLAPGFTCLHAVKAAIAGSKILLASQDGEVHARGLQVRRHLHVGDGDFAGLVRALCAGHNFAVRCFYGHGLVLFVVLNISLFARAFFNGFFRSFFRGFTATRRLDSNHHNQNSRQKNFH